MSGCQLGALFPNTTSPNMQFQIVLDANNATCGFKQYSSGNAPIQLSVCSTIAVTVNNTTTYYTFNGIKYTDSDNTTSANIPNNFVCSLAQMAELTSNNYYISGNSSFPLVQKEFTSGLQNFPSSASGVTSGNYTINLVKGLSYFNTGGGSSTPNPNCVNGPMVYWDSSNFYVLGNLYYCGNFTSSSSTPDASTCVTSSLVLKPADTDTSYFQMTTELPLLGGTFYTTCMLFPYISNGTTTFGVADVILSTPLNGSMFNNIYDSGVGWSGYLYVFICTDSSNPNIGTAVNNGYTAFPEPVAPNNVYPFIFDPQTVVMSDTTSSWATVGTWANQQGNSSGVATTQASITVEIQQNQYTYNYGGWIPVNWGGNSDNYSNQNNTYPCMRTFNPTNSPSNSNTSTQTPTTYQSSLFLVGSCSFIDASPSFIYGGASIPNEIYSPPSSATTYDAAVPFPPYVIPLIAYVNSA